MSLDSAEAKAATTEELLDVIWRWLSGEWPFDFYDDFPPYAELRKRVLGDGGAPDLSGFVNEMDGMIGKAVLGELTPQQQRYNELRKQGCDPLEAHVIGREEFPEEAEDGQA